MRYILLCLIFFSLSYGVSFRETRYSDAFNKSVEFHGDITFSQYGVAIKYNENNKSILYDDGELELYDGEKELLLDEYQQQKMGAFLDILILLHANNKREIEDIFNISKKSDIEVLLPKDEAKEYLKKIELKRVGSEFAFIKLFFKNNDTIEIKIDDETN